MSNTHTFVNGFTSWVETYYEIVSAIELQRNREELFQPRVIKHVQNTQGTGGFYELAEDLTNKFEKAYKGETWEEKDFFETIESFINVNIIHA